MVERFTPDLARVLLPPWPDRFDGRIPGSQPPSARCAANPMLGCGLVEEGGGGAESGGVAQHVARAVGVAEQAAAPPHAEVLGAQAQARHQRVRLRWLLVADRTDRPPQRVAELVGLPQSTTSRLVARLENAGLLERYLCDTDRRGVYTQITPAGRAIQAAAAATYDDVLREVL
ncbi:MAG TPA: MarR family transcriptional regulator [Micromonosporaceae bacterium]|nr:MarR family transcriptional regulator [Micromonosporaceae bacterium]